MTTINLQQTSQEMQEKNMRWSKSGGFIFSLVLPILALLAMGGIKLAISLRASQNAKLAESVQAENLGLSEKGGVDKVVDIQTRLDRIKKNLASRVDMDGVLDNVAADMASGTVLTKYTYDDKGVTVSLMANSFSDASQQLLNFKKSEHFTNATLQSINRGDKGITFNITMGLK